MMSEARGRFTWQQTSLIVATIANIMRDPQKSEPISASDINPYECNQKKKILPVAPITILRDVFCKDKKSKCH